MARKVVAVIRKTFSVVIGSLTPRNHELGALEIDQKMDRQGFQPVEEGDMYDAETTRLGQLRLKRDGIRFVYGYGDDDEQGGGR